MYTLFGCMCIDDDDWTVVVVIVYRPHRVNTLLVQCMFLLLRGSKKKEKVEVVLINFPGLR